MEEEEGVGGDLRGGTAVGLRAPALPLCPFTCGDGIPDGDAPNDGAAPPPPLLPNPMSRAKPSDGEVASPEADFGAAASVDFASGITPNPPPSCERKRRAALAGPMVAGFVGSVGEAALVCPPWSPEDARRRCEGVAAAQADCKGASAGRGEVSICRHVEDAVAVEDVATALLLLCDSAGDEARTGLAERCSGGCVLAAMGCALLRARAAALGTA